MLKKCEASFRQCVESLVSRIPSGRVMTYGQIAALCGSPLAVRVVGAIAHYGNPSLPWQRVINKNGGLAAGYPGGRNTQQEILLVEGVEISNYRVKNLVSLIWWPEK